MARTVRAYVALGANVGDARRTLEGAVRALAALPGVRLRGVSRLYRTKPVGVEDQADFLNAVVALDVPRGADPQTGALALLVAMKGLEHAFGRRDRERWGPRELDLDLVIFGRHRFRVERTAAGRSDGQGKQGVQWLEVPHPSARGRLFVVAPLADLAPRLVPPGWRETVRAARGRLERMDPADAVVPVAAWRAASSGWVPVEPRVR